MAFFPSPRLRRVLASVVIGGAMATAGCTGDSPEPTPTTSFMPPFSAPQPDPETSPPAPGSDYEQAIADFCDLAAQTRASLTDMAETGVDEAQLLDVEQKFHDGFAVLFAAHKAQFGDELSGVEPLNSGFAVDAAIAILASETKSDTGVTLDLTDPIFVQLDDVATGCATHVAKP